MTLKELIQRAVDAASRAKPESPTATALEAIAESVLPTVFKDVGEEAARSETTRHLLRRTKEITFTTGTMLLPNDILSAHIREANMLDSTDKTKRYSYTEWHSFVKDLDTRLGYFSVEGESTIHVVEPGSSYDPLAGPDITLLLTTPCIPVIPILAGNSIAVADEVATMLLARLTQVLSA